jgi:hypothetical protein
MGRAAAVGNLFGALDLDRQAVSRLSRQDKQLERRFREHAAAEQAKNAPSQEVEAFFAGTTEATCSVL